MSIGERIREIDLADSRTLGNVIGIVLVAFSIAYGVISFAVEKRQNPVPPPRHDEFVKYEFDELETYEFSIATGFDTTRAIPLTEEQMRTLFVLLRDGLERNTKARYNATSTYKLTMEFSDGKTFEVWFLRQNYDDLRVIFENRRYDSPRILEWFRENREGFAQGVPPSSSAIIPKGIPKTRQEVGAFAVQVPVLSLRPCTGNPLSGASLRAGCSLRACFGNGRFSGGRTSVI